MTTTVTAVPTATLCDNLTALGYFLRGTDLPALPHVTSNTLTGKVHATWMLFGDHHDLAEQKAQAASIVQAIGGHWDKGGGDSYSRFVQGHDRFVLEVIVDRPAVCERVVVGTHAEERVVPAVEAAAEHVVTETVEDVEWVCGSLLSDTEQVES